MHKFSIHENAMTGLILVLIILCVILGCEQQSSSQSNSPESAEASDLVSFHRNETIADGQHTNTAQANHPDNLEQVPIEAVDLRRMRGIFGAQFGVCLPDYVAPIEPCEDELHTAESVEDVVDWNSFDVELGMTLAELQGRYDVWKSDIALAVGNNIYDDTYCLMLAENVKVHVISRDGVVIYISWHTPRISVHGNRVGEYPNVAIHDAKYIHYRGHAHMLCLGNNAWACFCTRDHYESEEQPATVPIQWIEIGHTFSDCDGTESEAG